jgi:cytochrome c553
MSTQHPNHHDTPLHHYRTFLWGMLAFAFFGVASIIVYVSTSGNAHDVETLRATDRLTVQAEVTQAQSALLKEKEVDGGKSKQVPPAKVFPALSKKIQATPKASEILAADSEAMKKKEAAMAKKGGEGFELYKAKACNSCHGIDANHPISPLYPILGGLAKEYLLGQMDDIKSGKRNNGQTAAMKAIIANVSDAEMKKIAQWISEQKHETALPEDHQGAGLFMAKGCVACHGINAQSSIMPLYPNIARQNKEYLINQIKDIKSGARNNGMTELMKPLLVPVTEDEIKIIAEWLSTPTPAPEK